MADSPDLGPVEFLPKHEAEDCEFSQKTDSDFSSSQSQQALSHSQEQRLEDRQRMNRMIQALNVFCDEAAISRLNFARIRNWKFLSRRSKRNRIYTMREIQRNIFSLFALYSKMGGKSIEDDVIEISRLVNEPLTKYMWEMKSTADLNKVLGHIAEAYQLATSSRDRSMILSGVAEVFTLAELQNAIPALTPYRLKVARKLRWHQAAGIPLSEQSKRKVRYEPEKVHFFANYMASEPIMMDLPFGSYTTKLSTGEVISYAATMRRMRHTNIVRTYKQYLIDSGNADMDMSESTLMRMLNYIKAKQRKRVIGMDLYNLKANEGFDNLFEVLDKLKGEDTMDPDYLYELIVRLKEARQYLYTYFRLHLKRESLVPSHCFQLALSDPSNFAFTSDCGHEHTLPCGGCLNVRIALSSVQSLLTSSTINEETKAEYLHVVGISITDIFELEKHLTRSAYLERVKRDAIDGLGYQDILCVSDWMMRFLPKMGRESSRDWYGKRGISVHIMVCYARFPTKELYSRTLIHVFESCRQDADATVAIFRHAIGVVKSELPIMNSDYVQNNINDLDMDKRITFTFKQDNAGNYKSGHFVASLAAVGNEMGVHVKRVTYNEPQSGKDAADQIASTIKAKIGRFCDEGGNARNAKEFVQAAQSRTELIGHSFFVSEVETANRLNAHNRNNVRNKANIPGITSYMDFQYTENHEKLVVWRHFGIGKGMEVPPIYWKNKAYFDRLKVVEESHHSSTVPHPTKGDRWKKLQGSENQDGSQSATEEALTSSDGEFEALQSMNAMGEVIEQNSEIPEEEDEPDNENHILYFCPIRNCLMTFKRYSNLEKHLALANHKYAPDQLTLRDKTLQLFKQELERPSYNERIPEVNDAIANDQTACEEANDINSQTYTMGWALKVQRPCKRFNQKQVQFLVNKFNEKYTAGKRADPITTAEMMKTARKPDGTKMFTTSEYLTSYQVAGFFTRQAEKRRKAATEESTSEVQDPSNVQDPSASTEPETVDQSNNTCDDEEVT